MNRRRFLRQSALASAAAATSGLAAETGAEIIDIHQHVHYSGRLNDAFVAHQRAMGISRTVLLPSASAVLRRSTHEGKSNGLAARVHGTEASARLAAQFPKEFVFFCNEVPDIDTLKPELEKWLEKGACGIGEQKFNLPCDSKPMRLVFDIAKAHEVPVLLHFQHGMYNTGFANFEKILKDYPTVNFIGHAQTWWGHIDAKHEPKALYPKGKVTPGGLTDRYLSDYPNIFGDLSAGSGRNSLSRDLEHGAAFLERHQDKLCYGTDCSDSVGEGEKCIGATTAALIRQLLPDPTAHAKIFAGNARRVIRFPE